MKTIILLVMILTANQVMAENYQYIIVGTGNGKKVTGFVTDFQNGTLEGSVDGKFVSGQWVGLGSCQLFDGENFYEMEVF